jgi:hypothetical protein
VRADGTLSIVSQQSTQTAAERFLNLLKGAGWQRLYITRDGKKREPPASPAG